MTQRTSQVLFWMNNCLDIWNTTHITWPLWWIGNTTRLITWWLLWWIMMSYPWRRLLRYPSIINNIHFPPFSIVNDGSPLHSYRFWCIIKAISHFMLVMSSGECQGQWPNVKASQIDTPMNILNAYVHNFLHSPPYRLHNHFLWHLLNSLL